METNKIEAMAIEELKKRLGTDGYVNNNNCLIPYTDGFEDGYKKGLEAKINTTTISDCPLLDGDAEKDIKIQMLSQKVYDLQEVLEVLREKNRLAAEQDARDIRSRFPC